MDREADSDIPRKLWENWIPVDGKRVIVRELTTSERGVLQRRAVEIECGLSPFSPEQRDEAKAPLHAMLGGFRSLRESGEDAETAVEVLLAVLREFPVWAIEQACLRIAKRDIDLDPPLDPRWAPSDAQIYAAIAKIVRPYRESLASAKALLSAPVATQEPARPSRAELEAKLGRAIGERPSVKPVAVSDGRHASRIADDLAARKARNDQQKETTGPPASPP